MGTYRISRNLEASLIEYLQTELSASWSNINVVKTFKEVFEISVPTVCVRAGVAEHSKVQMGDDSTVREAQILIDIFAHDDGNRLDMKDFLIEKLRGGLPYTEFEITNGAISNRTINGRIRVLTIDDTPINFGDDKNTLDVHDRYRHLLTLTVSLGRVEA